MVSVTESYSSGFGLVNRTVVNSYDGIYRLLNEASTVAGITTNTSYTYDNANNRTSKSVQAGSSTAAVTNYNYNNLNQIVTTSGALVTAFTYDVDGNRLTSLQGIKSDSYSYDAENRLINRLLKKGKF